VAIDELAERFGTDVVHRASDFTKPPGVRMAPTLDFLDDPNTRLEGAQLAAPEQGQTYLSLLRSQRKVPRQPGEETSPGATLAGQEILGCRNQFCTMLTLTPYARTYVPR